MDMEAQNVVVSETSDVVAVLEGNANLNSGLAVVDDQKVDSVRWDVEKSVYEVKEGDMSGDVLELGADCAGEEKLVKVEDLGVEKEGEAAGEFSVVEVKTVLGSTLGLVGEEESRADCARDKEVVEVEGFGVEEGEAGGSENPGEKLVFGSTLDFLGEDESSVDHTREKEMVEFEGLGVEEGEDGVSNNAGEKTASGSTLDFLEQEESCEDHTREKEMVECEGLDVEEGESAVSNNAGEKTVSGWTLDLLGEEEFNVDYAREKKVVEFEGLGVDEGVAGGSNNAEQQTILGSTLELSAEELKVECVGEERLVEVEESGLEKGEDGVACNAVEKTVLLSSIDLLKEEESILDSSRDGGSCYVGEKLVLESGVGFIGEEVLDERLEGHEEEEGYPCDVEDNFSSSDPDASTEGPDGNDNQFAPSEHSGQTELEWIGRSGSNGILIGSILCNINGDYVVDADKPENQTKESAADVKQNWADLAESERSPCQADYTKSEDGSGERRMKSSPTSVDQCKNLDACEADGVESKASSLEGSSVDALVKQKLFCYMIKVPKYFDDTVAEQIAEAQKLVDEKTCCRDAIKPEIQEQRARCSEYHEKYTAALTEERGVQGDINRIREEMVPLQAVLTRMKDATTVNEISARIKHMKYKIEHETLALKEEKQLIHEMKLLKLQHDQLASSLSKQAKHEVLPFDERFNAEERFKSLKKEMDAARKKFLHSQTVANDAWKELANANKKLKALQEEYRIANDRRQDAYIKFANLKNQLYAKNQHYRLYKEDVEKARNLLFTKSGKGGYRHCVNQVERVMNLWNSDDNFRKDYIRCNRSSTVQRLGTLDGRSLGPDEEPIVLRQGDVCRKVFVVPLASDWTDPKLKPPSPKPEKSIVEVGAKHKEAGSVVRFEQKRPAASTRKSAKQVLLEKRSANVSSMGNTSATVFGKDEAKEKQNELNKKVEGQELSRKTEEGEELLRKTEEMRREAADIAREKKVLEQRAKSKAAEEKRIRNEEKARARAEFEAQKEVALKEKKRAKRERQRQRKMAATAEGANGGPEGELENRSAENLPLESIQEPKIVVKPTKHRKPPAKQKTAALPASLRKNRRSMQPWMCLLLLLVLVLCFCFGLNYVLLV